MELESWFETFWQTYPKDLCRNRKGPKSVAKNIIINKLKPDELLQNDIMVKLRELIRHYRKEKSLTGDAPWWPHVSTWLNQERWNEIEDIESTADLIERSNKNKCKCGHNTDIGNECWDCYEGKTNNDHKRDKLLYDNLKAIGLGKRKDETRKEYSARCREYALTRTSLAGIHR